MQILAYLCSGFKSDKIPAELFIDLLDEYPQLSTLQGEERKRSAHQILLRLSNEHPELLAKGHKILNLIPTKYDDRGGHNFKSSVSRFIMFATGVMLMPEPVSL